MQGKKITFVDRNVKLSTFDFSPPRENKVEDIRHTPEYKVLYEKRKETIERVFADAKEKHSMRYTYLRGLSHVTNWVRLKFAAMNLKKYAIHRLKEEATLRFIWFPIRKIA